MRDGTLVLKKRDLWAHENEKLGFLRDLLEFRTRKFWQLGHDFIETHLQMLAHLGGVTTLNITSNQRRRRRIRVTALERAIQIVITPHHRDSILQRDPKRSSNVDPLPSPSPPLKPGVQDWLGESVRLYIAHQDNPA
jgi:hypothetical protein